MWILLIFLIIFVVLHFLPDSAPPKPSPRFRQETRGHISNPHWISFFERHCESPAEVGFLHAMVAAYALQPQSGALWGSGLQLDFQVEEGRYRLDFLVDRWLVVEIDGAAYQALLQKS